MPDRRRRTRKRINRYNILGMIIFLFGFLIVTSLLAGIFQPKHSIEIHGTLLGKEHGESNDWVEVYPVARGNGTSIIIISKADGEDFFFIIMKEDGFKDTFEVTKETYESETYNIGSEITITCPYGNYIPLRYNCK